MRRQEFITLVSSAGAVWPAVNSHFFRRLVRLLVACTVLAMLTPTRASFAAAGPKTVVFLHSEHQAMERIFQGT